MATLLTVNVAKLTALQGRLKAADKEVIKAAELGLADYGRVLAAAIQNAAPKDEGNFAMSSRFAVTNKGTKNVTLKVEIGTPSRPKKLAEWLIYGTGIYGPHRTPIVPKKAKFLRWSAGGETFFRRSVRGMRGRDFIKEAQTATAYQRKSLAARIGALVVQKLVDSRK